MSEVKAGQLVIAKSTDAAVFSDYKGSGLEKVVYSASKVGESLGVATGLSFPGTGVKFNWLEVVYVQQTNFIFGLPQLERKLGYVPDDQVTFKDPEPTKTTATGTTTTTPGTTPTQPGNTPNPDVTPTPGNDGKMTITANDKIITKKAVLPTWAYWALGGLGLTAAILIGVLVGKNKKGGKN
ncbi:hypothetical protein BWI97_14265 [Siphonobacter sp. BAB-5405]|uniref:hypothetical protein n=1 Tax=Siphonobacter sp. BAB-5405 TaxID=1864825 RepID=UPI000C80600B|nr:hypothetical protein [Siphonobacter sp. BAB-5405]PMD95516.1 hypothetical protein BWI97_14265 [Siphonobacter sp. BAB-5405]